MKESILESVKSKINVDPSDNVFDDDVVDYINTVFMTLNQMGVGPKEGFSIDDSTAVWDDFVTGNNMRAVRSYVTDKVRLMFDPPNNSSHIELINKRIAETEWRLNSEVDYS